MPRAAVRLTTLFTTRSAAALDRARRVSGGRSRAETLARERDERLRRVRERPSARTHQRDLARGLEPLHLGGGERARGQLRLDGGARDEAHAVARGDGALNRLLQAELEPDVEVAQARSRMPELVLDHLAHTRSFLHHDQRLFAQLLERELLAGEAVPGCADQHDFVAEERLEHD